VGSSTSWELATEPDCGCSLQQIFLAVGLTVFVSGVSVVAVESPCHDDKVSTFLLFLMSYIRVHVAFCSFNFKT